MTGNSEICYLNKNRSLVLRINEIAAEATKQLYLNENLPTFRIDSLFVIQFNKS